MSVRFPNRSDAATIGKCIEAASCSRYHRFKAHCRRRIRGFLEGPVISVRVDPPEQKLRFQKLNLVDCFPLKVHLQNSNLEVQTV